MGEHQGWNPPNEGQGNQPFFPVFLYNERMIDGSLTKGLFCGPLLLKVRCSPFSTMTINRCLQAFRYIFLGQGHVHRVTAKTKHRNASIHRMVSAKPSMICYTIIQVTEYTTSAPPVVTSVYTRFVIRWSHPDIKTVRASISLTLM